MKTLLGIGLAIVLAFPSGLMASEEKKDETFAQFVGKSAELYRGALMTRLEMAKMADELSHQTRRTSALPTTYLDSLKKNPYDITLTAWMLRWLEGEYNSRGSSEQKSKDRLRVLIVKLRKHYEILTQLADSYQG